MGMHDRVSVRGMVIVLRNMEDKEEEKEKRKYGHRGKACITKSENGAYSLKPGGQGGGKGR